MSHEQDDTMQGLEDVLTILMPGSYVLGKGINAAADALSDGPASSGGSFLGMGTAGKTGAVYREYAGKLRTLGYSAPDTDAQRDPGLMTAVRKFQQDVAPAAGVVDGLLGPNTNAAIDAALAQRGGAMPAVVAGATESGNTWLWVGGAAAVLGVAALLFLGKKKKA